MKRQCGASRVSLNDSFDWIGVEWAGHECDWLVESYDCDFRFHFHASLTLSCHNRAINSQFSAAAASIGAASIGAALIGAFLRSFISSFSSSSSSSSSFWFDFFLIGFAPVSRVGDRSAALRLIWDSTGFFLSRRCLDFRVEINQKWKSKWR